MIPSTLGTVTVSLLSTSLMLPISVQAQMNEQEFLAGRAREACQNQAKKQGL
ncbi:hypothetical protein [Chlorogloeopsis sp. ULAP02]|uniref:hypothetical protein n=1 Tax=Chlorogloeopsis sp. ULAP02 TaxID=3107926 RepID=UPI00313568B2